MKIYDNFTKNYLKYTLMQLKKTNGSKIIIEILEIILDENKSHHDIAIKLPTLKALIKSVDLVDLKSLDDSGVNFHQDLDETVNVEEPQALWLLGICHSDGYGTGGKNYTLAVKLFEIAAKTNAAARSYLGKCYQDGLGPKLLGKVMRPPGVKIDLKRALELYIQSAYEGDALALTNLGYCYQQNIIGKDNKPLEKAFELYKLAAAQGYAVAQTYLGICYLEGLGTNKNLKQAIELFFLAANQEYAEAQYQIGIFYYNGIGVEQDLKLAAEYFQKAASQKNGDAQFNLGRCYLKGIGVKQDPYRAVELFRVAGVNGCKDASVILGDCYRDGIGVSQDLDRARCLYLTSGDQQALGNLELLSKKEPTSRQNAHSRPGFWSWLAADFFVPDVPIVEESAQNLSVLESGKLDTLLSFLLSNYSVFNQIRLNQITHLTLAIEDFEHESQINALSLALTQNTSISSLELKAKGGTDTNKSFFLKASHIVKFLENNNNILTLKMQCFGHTKDPKERQEFIDVLAKALENNKCLENLVLAFIGLGSLESASLFKALQKNTTLKSIDISTNWLNSADSKQILETLTVNNSINKIICSKNCSGFDEKSIQKKLEDNRHKRFLSEFPQYSLCVYYGLKCHSNGDASIAPAPDSEIVKIISEYAYDYDSLKRQ